MVPDKIRVTFHSVKYNLFNVDKEIWSKQGYAYCKPVVALEGQGSCPPKVLKNVNFLYKYISKKKKKILNVKIIF